MIRLIVFVIFYLISFIGTAQTVDAVHMDAGRWSSQEVDDRSLAVQFKKANGSMTREITITGDSVIDLKVNSQLKKGNMVLILSAGKNELWTKSLSKKEGSYKIVQSIDAITQDRVVLTAKMQNASGTLDLQWESL
ncbi:MAG: hypothetical protein WBA16_03495 [Nonlabens sp.]